MINKSVNISLFDGVVPTGEPTDRKYLKGPVYPIEQVLNLAEKTKLQFWSKGSALDAQKWKIDTSDAAILVNLALTTGKYLASEWCQQRPQGPWAMCDAYKVTRLEWIENASKNMPVSYYLKFAISKTGQLLLMASNHPEGA